MADRKEGVCKQCGQPFPDTDDNPESEYCPTCRERAELRGSALRRMAEIMSRMPLPVLGGSCRSGVCTTCGRKPRT